MKTRLEVFINDEFIDDTPDVAYAEIDKDFLERIFDLQKIMKEKDIDEICNYDGGIIFMDNNVDGEEEENKGFQYECLQICICKDFIYWKFLVNHTDVSGSTQLIYTIELNDFYKALTIPYKKLPLLVNHENPYVQQVIKERLNNG